MDGHDARRLERLALYEQIVETTSEGVWVIDANSCTTFVNQSMANMLGYTREELVGRSMFELMDDEGREIAAAAVERRKHGISEAHEFVFRRKDGQPLWTRMTTNPLTDSRGGYAGALALVIDITRDRRGAAERERLWRILDESLNEIYLFREHDLRFEYVNRGALTNLGFSLDEMLSRTPVDIKPTPFSLKATGAFALRYSSPMLLVTNLPVVASAVTFTLPIGPCVSWNGIAASCMRWVAGRTAPPGVVAGSSVLITK